MRAVLLAFVLLVSVVFASAAFAQNERYQASGTVVAIDHDLGRVTIDTEPIEALKLPALGLAFIVHDRRLLDRVRNGRKVEFEFVKQGRGFVLVKILKNVP